MFESFFADFSAPHSLLRLTLLAIVLASVASGIIGGYVVARRCSYVVGAISHALLGGIGVARLCQTRWGMLWFTPMLGAVLAAVAAATLISLLSRQDRLREDTVISAVWAVGMAAGVSCIFAIPGYPEDLSSYLFGNILLISRQDLWLMGILDLLVLLTAWMFHNRLLALSFHEEGLRLRGVNTGLFMFILNLLIALTVVLLAQVAGIILCLALLILPTATATLFSRNLAWIMALAVVICLGGGLGGLVLSYEHNLPTGATIVEVIGVGYLLTAVLQLGWRRLCQHSS